jgi:hypothetical protein
VFSLRFAIKTLGACGAGFDLLRSDVVAEPAQDGQGIH